MFEVHRADTMAELAMGDQLKLHKAFAVLRVSKAKILCKAFTLWSERVFNAKPSYHTTLSKSIVQHQSPQAATITATALSEAGMALVSSSSLSKQTSRRGSTVIIKESGSRVGSRKSSTDEVILLEPERRPAHPYKRHSEINKKWRNSIQKVISLSRYASAMNPNESATSTMPSTSGVDGGKIGDGRKLSISGSKFDAGEDQRLIDYFITFGVHPPEEFEDVNFDTWPESEVEKVLRQTQVFAGIIDRYPRTNYPGCPVSDVWTSLAFPTGILLSWELRQPRLHFAVVTYENGKKVYLTFLQYDVPLDALMMQYRRKKSSQSMSRTNSSTSQSSGTGNVAVKRLYTPKALCLVTHVPYLAMCRDLLKQLHDAAISKSRNVAIETLVGYIVKALPCPIPGEMAVQFQLMSKYEPIRISAPPLRDPETSTLPLTQLFNLLGIDSVLGIFASMLFEQRILLHSNSLSSLTIVCQCMMQLLYPFAWCSVYVPVLAELMLDAYQCPQPYIQGVHTKYLSRFTDLSDIVLVDIDHNIIRCSKPLNRLPPQSGGLLWTRLREILERHASDRDVAVGARIDTLDPEASREFDIDIQDAFLSFFADVCSGFRRFLFFINDVPFFNGSGFLNSKSTEDGCSEFLDQMVDSRTFGQFLEDEIQPDLYHDFLATNSSDVLNHIRRIECDPVPVFDVAPPKHDSSFPVLGKEEDLGNPFGAPLRSQLLKQVRRTKLVHSNSKMRVSPRHRTPNKRKKSSGDDDIHMIGQHMSKIFSSREIGKNDFDQIANLLHRQEVRMWLARIMKQPLAKGPALCLSSASFKALATTLQLMLRICGEHKDYSSAVHVLEGSTIFFREKDAGRGREYIESAIQNHELWRNVEFWESALEMALEQVDSTPSVDESKPTAYDSPTMRRMGSLTRISSSTAMNAECHRGSMDRESLRRDAALNWLMTSTHKMLSYGMAADAVTTTAIRLGRKYDLSAEALDTLQKFLYNIINAVAHEIETAD